MVEDLTALRNAQAALQESENARRELARRLTNAQEKERTRIARELHDDIGQSLAILRIQMLRAGQPVSGAVGKTHPTVADLCDNLKVLAEKVSRLSQELHSSRLEYLGLAVAIQSHCREFSAFRSVPQNVPYASSRYAPDSTRDAVSQNVLSKISGPPKDIRAKAPLIFHHLTRYLGQRPGPKKGW